MLGEPQDKHFASLTTPSDIAVNNAAGSLVPLQVYKGSFGETSGSRIELRIGNGGAGQTGLIGALANAFIDHEVKTKRRKPFQVGWYLGHTMKSLGFLENNQVDIAITYRKGAEDELLKAGSAVERVYAFRDHFMLVGPPSNPAGLAETDDILTMFNKITKHGQADPPTEPATRFLSRFDKSATNVKESELFVEIGQVPWAYAYSTWYHQYPRFPIEALRAAATMEEYTLTDRGTYTASSRTVQEAVKIFLIGSDQAHDRLLNAARALRSARPMNEDLAVAFMNWLKSDTGGQEVVRNFSVDGVVMYSPAPHEDE